MKQPALGLVATGLVIALSMAFISFFDFETFSGWASYLMMCLIPMQLVVGVAWGANPDFAARLTQPLKGVVLVLVCVVAAAVVAPAYWQIAGAGLEALPPMLIMCTITSVIVMFWLAIMMGGWPFNVISKSQVVSGLLMLVACYVLNYALFRIFFSYEFMRGAPVYVASLDPGGLFNATNALVFYMCFVTFLFVLLHFDLWPLTSVPGIMKQPVLGLVWTALALVLGAGLFYVGVTARGADAMAFLVQVPVPFIFGTIVVLNMLHNSLFAKLQQPTKGIANTVAAAVIGTLLAQLYGALVPTLTGNVAPGPPGNDFERWLASALLAVTFPGLIFYAEFFKMWPLTGAEKK